MINFRYHIVSLMAVFLALAVGIAVGVSLSPSVSAGLNEQAAQDRKQVTALRGELDRVNALDEYRDAWAGRAGQQLALGALTGVGVAVVAMPDAPNPVVQALTDGITAAGGTVVRTVRVDPDVFDPTKAEVVDEAVGAYTEELGLQEDMTPATKFGRALGFSIAAQAPQERDDLAVGIGDALQGAGLATLSEGSNRPRRAGRRRRGAGVGPPARPGAAAGARPGRRRPALPRRRAGAGRTQQREHRPAPTCWPRAPTTTPPTWSAPSTWPTCRAG